MLRGPALIPRLYAGIACVLLTISCSDEPVTSADAGAPPVDPFVAGPILHLDAPPRALALVPRSGGGADIAAVLELKAAVAVVEVGQAGALTSGPTLLTGAGPRSVAFVPRGDDGSLVTADTSGSTLTRFDVGPSGLSMAGVEVPIDSPPLHLAAADIDAAAGAELVATVGLDAGGGAVQLVDGADLTPLGAPIGLESPSAACAGDATGDGDSDVVVLLGPSGQLVVLVGDGAGGLAVQPARAACSEPLSCTIADVDADGDADVVVACEGGARILFGPGPSDRTVVLAAPGRLYGVVALDLDGDSRIDVAGVDVLEHAAHVWLAPGATGLPSASSHVVARGPVGLDVGDVDGDGDPDLAIAGYEERGVQILLNQGPD